MCNQQEGPPLVTVCRARPKKLVFGLTVASLLLVRLVLGDVPSDALHGHDPRLTGMLQLPTTFLGQGLVCVQRCISSSRDAADTYQAGPALPRDHSAALVL